MATGNEPIGRREFFGTLLRDMKYLAGTALKAATAKKKIRPPGAMEEIAFLAGCQRCGRCAAVCPEKAIRIAGPDQGTAVGTPYLVPDEQPCSFCLQCVETCPSGALELPKDSELYPIGIATIDPNLCLAYNQQLCSSCLYVCPGEIKAIHLEDFQFPKVNPETCIGCGQCAKICIASISAIHVIPRDSMRK